MNPEAILALIADLYGQVAAQTQKIQRLEAELAAKAEKPAKP